MSDGHDDIRRGDTLVTKAGCHIRTFTVDKVDVSHVHLKSVCLRYTMHVTHGRHREMRVWSDKAKASLAQIDADENTTTAG